MPRVDGLQSSAGSAKTCFAVTSQDIGRRVPYNENSTPVPTTAKNDFRDTRPPRDRISVSCTQPRATVAERHRSIHPAILPASRRMPFRTVSPTISKPGAAHGWLLSRLNLDTAGPIRLATNAARGLPERGIVSRRSATDRFPRLGKKATVAGAWGRAWRVPGRS